MYMMRENSCPDTADGSKAPERYVLFHFCTMFSVSFLAALLFLHFICNFYVHWRSQADMVILFTSDVVNPPATIYMGRDKHENEDLIRWGWPEDVWFHVDKLSSAHVYLRLNPGQNLEEVPDVLIEDCAQLVKANSIQGCKLNNVKVVYTKWENLNKTGDMDVGQIGFHHNKAVHIVTVDRKNPEIIKRLEKTRQEVEIDYRREREMRDKREADGKKKAAKEEQERLKLDMLKKDEEMRIRSYADVFTPEKMAAQPKDGNDSDDFM